jgi:flagellar motor switch protein FliM
LSSNLEPEEAQAIRELLAEPRTADAEVVERDFRTPRRLSPPSLEGLVRELRSCVGNVGDDLGELIGKACPVEVASVSEASAGGLFSSAGDPLAAIRFDVGGQLGWILWDNVAAVRAVEKVLGSTSRSARERRFSAIELPVLESLLGCFARGIVSALGVEASGFTLVKTTESLVASQEDRDDPDPHRLHVELAVDGPGDSSTANVYVPVPERGVTDELAGVAPLEQPAHIALPSHLGDVELDVSVRIDGCDVSLDQLLALEHGDVIPLDARVGDPAHLHVDGRVFGHGSIGTRNGHLALRIDRLNIEESE